MVMAAKQPDIAPTDKIPTTLELQLKNELNDQVNQEVVARSNLPDLRPAFVAPQAFKYTDVRSCSIKIMVENWGAVVAPASKVKLKWQTTANGSPIEITANVGAIPAHNGSGPGIAYSDSIPNLRLFSIHPETRFYITVDAENTVFEGGINGETNNFKLYQWSDALFPPLCLPKRADLIISEAKWTDNCDLEVKVKNQGQVPTSAFADNIFYTRVNGVTSIRPQAGGLSSMLHETPVIAPGSTSTFTTNGYRPINSFPLKTKITADTPLGNLSYGSVFETLETNNHLSITPAPQCLVPPPSTANNVCENFWAIYHRNDDSKEFVAQISWSGEILSLFDLGISSDASLNIGIFQNEIYVRDGNGKLYRVDPWAQTKTYVTTLGHGNAMGGSVNGLVFDAPGPPSQRYIRVYNPNLDALYQQILYPSSLNITDIAESDTHEHFAIQGEYSLFGTFSIYKIDTFTGNMQIFTPSPTASLPGHFYGLIKYGSQLLAGGSSIFYKINPNTYEITAEFSIAGGFIHDMAVCQGPILP